MLGYAFAEEQPGPYRGMTETTQQEKTDRYLIKYKSSSGEASAKLGEKIKDQKDVNGGRGVKAQKLELLVLDQPLSQEELAEELREAGMTDAIEYIQPDFKLSPAAVELAVQESPEEDVPEEDAPELPEEDVPEEDAPELPEEDVPEEDAPEPPEEDVPEEDTPTSSGEMRSEDITVEPRGAVIVAVIDTGADITHDQIKNYLWTDNDRAHGWNFVQGNGQVYDASSPQAYAHGTHISGILAQVAQSENVPLQLMSCKVFDNGAAYTSDVIEAIEFAGAAGARVINMSFGGTQENPALLEAMRNSDALFVTAAGNHRMDLGETPIYPACFDLPNSINVSSTNADGGFSYFSNYSTERVDLAACGRNVLSAFPENQTGRMSGTSMAAAYVSGVAMAVASRNANMTAAQLKTRLLTTAERFSNLQNKVSGGRHVHLDHALRNVAATGITQKDPADDFDVAGYDPTPEEQLQLFSSAEPVAVAAGANFSLALLGNGTVWAWGENTYGQLGNGSTLNQANPVRVIGLNDVVEIAAGAQHALARKSDGTVWAWGANSRGQLGTGNTEYSLFPVQVYATGAEKIAAGSEFTMLLAGNDRSLYLCGDNSHDQLGQIMYCVPYSVTFIAPDGISTASEIAAGGTHCLAYKNGALWSWGGNSSGQLGIGDKIDSSVALQVMTFSAAEWSGMAAGFSHSMVADQAHSVKTWGDNLSYQLGDINLVSQNWNGEWEVAAERLVPGGCSTNAIKIAKGACAQHCLAIAPNGNVVGWGSNASGQLGVRPYYGYYLDLSAGSADAEFEAGIPMFVMAEAADVAVGESHSVILRQDGTIWTLGKNTHGQLGNGTVEDSDIPVSAGINYHCESFDMAWKIDPATRYVGTIDRPYVDDYLRFTISEAGTYLIHVNGASIAAALYHAQREKIGEMVSNREGRITAQLAAGEYYLRLSSNDPGRYAVSIHTMMNEARVQRLVMGSEFALALKDDGTLRAWGDNGSKQLGIGVSDDERAEPVQIDGLERIVSVAAGGYHGAAVREDGTVWAWGDNQYGQLGDLTTTARSAPVQVRGLLGVTQVSAGLRHTMALKSDGTVWTWGYNYYGELGDGTNTNRNAPSQVVGLAHIVAISAAGSGCLALQSDGTVWAWGDNTFGQLGDGTTAHQSTPKKVPGLSSVSDISAGVYHCLARKSDGTVWAWGDNTYGQLGDGTTTGRHSPVQVSGLTDAIAITAGRGHSVASKLDGSVWTWGGAYAGQLGNGLDSAQSTPVQVSGLAGIVSLSAGENSNLALRNDGCIYAWGANTSGQLCDGTKVKRSSVIQVLHWFPADLLANPVRIGANTQYSGALTADALHTCIQFTISEKQIYRIRIESAGITATLCTADKKQRGTAFYETKQELAPGDYYLIIQGQAPGDYTLAISATQDAYRTLAFAAGSDHTMILMSNHTVWGTGDNMQCQINGMESQRSSPVLTMSGVAQVSAHGGYTIACKQDGTVYEQGKFILTSPTQVNGLTEIAEISAGESIALARKQDGTVWSWSPVLDTPSQVAGLSDVVAISAGKSHQLALLGNGTVWAWGVNAKGQLGDGTGITTQTPVCVSGLSDIIAISCRGDHNLALKNDGTVWAWGANESGQLGDGTTTNRPLPASISGLEGVTAISAGSSHSMALKNDGTVWAWGANESGQLGDGTTTARSLPGQVVFSDAVSVIHAGFQNSFAAGENAVFAWGANASGQLGNGTRTGVSSPAALSAWCYPTSLESATYLTVGNSVTQQVTSPNVTLYYRFWIKTAGEYHVQLSGVQSSIHVVDDMWMIYGQGSGAISLEPKEYYVMVSPTVGTFELSVLPGGAGSAATTLQAVAGKVYAVSMRSADMADFSAVEYTLKYPAELFELITACGASATPVTENSAAPYAVPDTDVVITRLAPGVIQFKTTKTVASGTTWSGVVNTIKLKAKVTGPALLEPSVEN